MDKKTLIIILIVFIGSFSVTYFLIKRSKANKALTVSEYIPITNGVVGAVNYNGLEAIVMKEMFRNPSMLMKLKNDMSEKQLFGDVMAAVIKGGLDKDQKIIFSLSPQIKKGSFVLIAITDEERIQENLKNQLSAYSGNSLTLKETFIANYYPKEQMGVVLNKDFLLVLAGNEKNVTTTWKEITTQTNCYQDSNKNIASLIDNEHHISFWTDNNTLTSATNEKKKDEVITHIDFLDGKLDISATVNTENVYFDNTASKRFSCDTCALSFHLNMKNVATIPTFFNDSINQKVDSVTQLLNINYLQFLGNSNGKLDFTILGKGERLEKIVSYEFDDDFNKVKVEKTVATPVVNFVMNLGEKDKEMYQYFKNHNIIKTTNKEELLMNPLGKCYVKTEANQLMLTSNQTLFNAETITDANGFYLYADINKVINLLFKKPEERFKQFERIRAIANQKSKVVTINLEITTHNLDKNVLFDIAGAAIQMKK